MPELPSGTVTFLFTDVEGSTGLWERDRAAMRVAVERQLAVLRSIVSAHRGVLYKVVGDGTQAAFATAESGVRAALDAQRALLAESWTDAPGPLRVRMALHAGEAEPQDGDYLAAPLNRLARILDAAHGGQVLLSDTMAGLVKGALPEGVTIKALGEFRLRDILDPEQIFQLKHPSLRAEFPALNTPGELPHNLPTHPTQFLGREQELEAIETLLLQPSVRLVTLTGPGGVGKTRLGLRAAAEALEAFTDGVFLIDLARTIDPELVPSVTATALGLREQPGQTVTESLIAYLRDKQMLLVFDNFEHLLAAAALVAELLAAAPDVKVLATSRARLGLQAEHEYQVETLPVPALGKLPPLAELAHYDAVSLFVARAQALRPGFVLTEKNARAVSEIVCRLDGLPLAIELAAARVKLLTPEALLQRLERRLATLTGGARDLPARQRTLRDTIVWSHDLLAPAEQILFRRLSVFVGGWTLAGAEAVGAAPAVETIDPMRELSGLIDQSLVDEHPDAGASDEPRFRMLETLREFAIEQLNASGEMVEIERAVEEFFIQRAEAAVEGLKGSEQPLWLNRLEAENDNLRAAMGRALDRGDGAVALGLALRLWKFWETRGYQREGRAWLERSLALAQSVDAGDRAAAEFALGQLSFDMGDYDGAEAHYQKCLKAYRQLGDAIAEAEALSALAQIAVNRLAYKAANELGEESLRISRQSGDRRGMASALQVLGMVAREQGQYERALELFEESRSLGQALGNTAWTARITSQIGFTHRLAGNAEQAEHVLSASRRLHTELGDRFALGVIASELAHNAFDADDVDRAIVLYAEALRHYDAVGGSEAVVEAIEWLAVAAAAKGKAVPALRLFGAAETAREALRLPPRLESDELRVGLGLDQATQLAGSGANAALAEGRSVSLDHAREEALELAVAIADFADADS
jgi:predicted ATPase/class 3 adenylate cyclase